MLVLLLLPFYAVAMHNENSSRSSHLKRYVHVETSTRVLNTDMNFIDESNNLMVADSNKMVEVTLRIHRPNKPVKTITLNVDI